MQKFSKKFTNFFYGFQISKKYMSNYSQISEKKQIHSFGGLCPRQAAATEEATAWVSVHDPDSTRKSSKGRREAGRGEEAGGGPRSRRLRWNREDGIGPRVLPRCQSQPLASRSHGHKNGCCRPGKHAVVS